MAMKQKKGEEKHSDIRITVIVFFVILFMSVSSNILRVFYEVTDVWILIGVGLIAAPVGYGVALIAWRYLKKIKW